MKPEPVLYWRQWDRDGRIVASRYRRPNDADGHAVAHVQPEKQAAPLKRGVRLQGELL